MKILSKTLMLATAGAAMVALQAQAQTAWAPGDLLLDFRLASGGGSDVEINLGAFSSLSSFPTLNGDVNLSQFLPDITGAYSGSLSGLDWSVVGASAAGDNLWMTKIRPSSSPNYNNPAVDASTPWVNKSASVNSSTVTKINGIGSGANGGTSDGTGAATVSDGSAFSYHTLVGTGTFGGVFQGNVEAGTGTFTTGSVVRDDFYAMTAGASGNANYLGYFELNDIGGTEELLFVPAPEPMTYGLLSGIGLLAFSLRQQIRRFRA